MAKAISPFYPPRARWHGRIFQWGASLRRRLWLDRIHLPAGTSVAGLIGSVLIPGMGFYARGPKFLGKLALGACAILLVVFLVELGQNWANIAFGMLISIHASGLSYFCEPWLVGVSFRSRLLLTLGLLVALGALLYMPMRTFAEKHWVAPLHVRSRVVIIEKFGSAPRIQRGEWIAYSIPETGNHDAGYVQAGLGFGQVLAVGGDKIRFTPVAIEVNGVARPRLAYMPDWGEMVVPQKQWFIWPDIDIGGHGAAPAALRQLLLRMATVSQEQFFGRPLKRWFWRSQQLAA